MSDSDASVPSPDTPASINQKNAAAWKRDTSSTTGGSGSVPPNSRAAEGASFQPNAAGSIDLPRRASRTAQTLDPGRTWGTNDRVLQRAARYRGQMQRTNQRIAAVEAAWAGRR